MGIWEYPLAALKIYDAERRPAMAKALGCNRAGGPDGFDDIRDVLSEEELNIAASYHPLTGLTTDLVNGCRSLIPPEHFVI